MELRSFEPEVQTLADALRRHGWRLATAESCTGGLIAAACTAVAGSSDWFDRAYVSYSNGAKVEMLGVAASLITEHGAVSEVVARAMAEGALERAGVELSVAVTGIAGPGGATAGKPVGTVWLAVAVRGAAGGAQVTSARLQLDGDRDAVREHTVRQALSWLRQMLG
jgi:nicotinamide-nucleotide amidase